MNDERVTAYIERKPRWRAELTLLRELLLQSGLEETLKWNAPCYVHQGQNVVGMSGFKAYFGLWFYLGSRLDDHAGVLINAQEGQTRDLRQWRMRSATEIDADLISAYLAAAMALVDAGARASRVTEKTAEPCALLDAALAEDPGAREAYAGLTPGRQREYAAHINEAKREATKQKRLEAALQRIRQGVGLHDRYRGK